MKTIQNQKREPIAYELTNSKNQTFVKWARLMNSKEEIMNYLNTNFKFFMPLLISLPYEKESITIQNEFHTNLKLLHIFENGIVHSIEQLQKKTEVTVTKIPHLMHIVPEDYCGIYDVVASNSLLTMNPNIDSIKTNSNPSETIVEDLSVNEITQIILQDRRGEGLRSKLPWLYVWYNDLLFVVERISFPTVSASRAMTEEMREVVNALRLHGVTPILREAVYPKMFMSKLHEITPDYTWWGMENQVKFLQR